MFIKKRSCQFRCPLRWNKWCFLKRLSLCLRYQYMQGNEQFLTIVATVNYHTNTSKFKPKFTICISISSCLGFCCPLLIYDMYTLISAHYYDSLGFQFMRCKLRHYQDPEMVLQGFPDKRVKSKPLMLYKVSNKDWQYIELYEMFMWLCCAWALEKGKWYETSIQNYYR